MDRHLQNLDAHELREQLVEAIEDEETSRTVLLVGGGALALFGLTRMSPLGIVLSLVGGGLAYLGTQRKSIADYGRQARKVAAERIERMDLGGTVDIEETVIVERPPEEVYAYWRNFRNLQRWMKHIESVEVLPDGRSRWCAVLFEGAPAVEWDAETVEDVPNQRISWRSLPDGDIETFGTVRFEPTAGRGTRVHLTLQYRPPGGRIVATAMSPAVQYMAREDLRRFKHILEVGDTPRPTARPYEFE
jgi:uncharacterized membrane protein